MNSLRALALVLAIVALGSRAEAQASLIGGLGGTAGYGSQCLGMNDDGSSVPIDLRPFFPSGLRFFDTTHSTVYVNTNGNVSFAGPVPTFTAVPFPVADRPMIAPYWADVDIRTFDRVTGLMRRCNGPADGDRTLGAACHNPTENGVWWYLEPGRMIVTWDRVSYFKCHSDNAQRMSFQLVITEVESASCGALGDFDVELRYNRCEWTTGDASGGRLGFGGTQAQAGFDAGNLMDFVMIAGSRTDRIHEILCRESNVEVPGVWRFQIRSGEVICPGAGDPCPTGMDGVCATGRTQCVADRIECRSVLAPSEETCDALDDDCDGSVDEGTLCDAFEECREGTCIGVCFEGGCPSGFECTTGGQCVEEACVGITCGEGQRCEGGACVTPCSGVTCPHGLDCVAGRCLDLCADASCDDCSVCSGGACLTRCQLTPCPAGSACRVDGRCVAAACADITCDPGTHCEAGTCIDSCTGAICPSGEVCVMGECVPGTPLPDGGVVVTDGGGPGMLDASTPGIDAGPPRDAGLIDPGPVMNGGCGCRASGGSAPHGALLVALVLGVLFARRRR